MASNPTDTTTVINPGVGGDSLDESAVLQSDNATTAKRPRVDVGFQADASDGGDNRNALVSKSKPLPVSDRNTEILESIDRRLEELTEFLKIILSQ